MKKFILAAALGLLSFSSFANIDCSKSLDTIVSLSGSIGEMKAFTVRNNADLLLHKGYLKILNENSDANEVGGKTRSEIEQRIADLIQRNEDLKDEGEQESLSEMTKLIKESCF